LVDEGVEARDYAMREEVDEDTCADEEDIVESV
jgi:hypothetical protein